jgi:hypothetical protein
LALVRESWKQFPASFPLSPGFGAYPTVPLLPKPLFYRAEKEDQEMAEACKRLIKNCIICWNYLYLSQKLEEIEDAATRQVFLDAVAHGSVISWQHINLLGEYDFSDEKLQDNVGIRPPKLTP